MRRLGQLPAWPFLLALACLVVLFVVACGEGGPSDPSSSVGEGDYKAIVITYNGRPLRCVERKGTTGIDTTSGAYSGLSCDWVAFHKADPR